MYIPHIKLNEKGNLKVKGFCQISVNGGHKKFGIEGLSCVSLFLYALLL